MKVWGGGELPFRELFRRIYRKYDDDAVSDTASSLSYYFLFSLFPFLFFVATVTAFLPIGDSVESMLDRIRPILPPQAMALVDQHVRALLARPHPRLLTIGLLVSLYSASRGVDAVRKGLNLAYDVKESRPFWRTELLAIGMTLAGVVLLLVGIAALVAGGDLGFWLAQRAGITSAYLFAWRWIRWPVTAAVVMLIAALGYYLLPDVKQKFKYITPGSFFGTLVWIGGTLGFKVYVEHFSNYNITYGSLGGVIVLLTWLYISALIYSVGGEVNAILEHASLEGKAAGARAEGEAPPPPEERPSAMPPGAAGSQSAAEHSSTPAHEGA